MVNNQNPPQDSNQYPDHILDRLEKIEELKLQGKHEESISEATGLLVEDPDCIAALEELADNYVSLSEFDKAEKAAHRALNLSDKSYTAYYILGYIASAQQKWNNAVSLLTRANQLYANNTEILRCLGWALFNSSKRTQGIVVLERALNLEPDNALTLCDLGIAYLQTKNFQKAVELLKRAVEIDPSNSRAQECYKAAQKFSEEYGIFSENIRPKKTPQRKSFL